MIKEVIIVEGKDDYSAVKKAVDAEIIITHGFGLNDEIYRRIEFAYKNRGIIIFTDPDYAGENIRKKLVERFPEAKHAYLPLNEGTRKGNIGIENATPENINKALGKVKTINIDKVETFTINDLIEYELTGNADASKNREFVGNYLGIGYGNGKTFVKRLNNYGISVEEFNKAILELKKQQ